jgi:hypothetical protein
MEPNVFFYSYEKSFLQLSKKARIEHNITIFEITIPWNHKCFGEDMIKNGLNLLVGYETLLLNEFLHFGNHSGYSYSREWKEFYRLNIYENIEYEDIFGKKIK